MLEVPQSFPSPPVVIGACEIGAGVFATRQLMRGELIFRLQGPVISRAECCARGTAECYPVQIGKDEYIDVDPPGRFLNHSCAPNVGLRGRDELIALFDISTGQELRLDYSTTMSERRWTMRCSCGAPTCRGTIGDFHALPQELQRRYLALNIVQPFIVAEREAP